MVKRSKKTTNSTEEDITTRVEHVDRVDPNKIKVNDLMTFAYWGKIEAVDKNQSNIWMNFEPTVQVKNILDGKSFTVHGNELIKNSYSADQYHTEEKVTQTRLAEILVSSFNVPLTVEFIKLDGTKRTLRGKFIKNEPQMGRSYVVDLDISDKNKTRLVDHRTLQSIIVNGVKYMLKE